MNPIDALKRARARAEAKGEDTTEIDRLIVEAGQNPRVERAVVNPARVSRRGH